MIVEDLKSHWYLTGEEIDRGMRIFAEAGSQPCTPSALGCPSCS
jgi:hypothetical protein